MSEAVWTIPRGLLNQPVAPAMLDLKKAGWFSFDVFDTLVKRDCSSQSDLFRLVARDLDVDQEHFVRARGQADELAQSINANYTLSDIYNNLTGFSPEDRERLLRAEVRMEVEIATRNDKAFALFEQALATSQPVVLISDMYLPSAAIEEILGQAQIGGYQSLFVSNEWNASKRDGALFKVVARELRLPIAELVHIGDSPRRDFVMPRRVGARSILVRRRLRTDVLETRSRSRWSGGSLVPGLSSEVQRSVDRNLAAFLTNRDNDHADDLERFGFEALGPLLYGFVQWLKDRMVEGQLDHAVFVARDGQILMRAFEALGIPESRIKSTYLFASRQSLRLPAVLANDQIDRLAAELFFAKRTRTAAELLDEIGATFTQSADILASAEVAPTVSFDRDSYQSSPQFGRLMKTAAPFVRAYAADQKVLLSDYLDQLGIRGKIGLVDSGWSGTVQAYLQEATDPGLVVNGFYLGVGTNVRQRLRVTPMKLFGYLVDYSKVGAEDYLLDVMLGFIEAWLYAPHGTTLRYRLNASGEVEPQLAEPDNRDVKANADVKRAQDAAIRFVEAYARSPLGRDRLPRSSAFDRFQSVALRPRSDHLQAFGDVTNNGRRLAPSRPSLAYLRAPSLVIADFRESRWKAAFLKRVLKLPLPYSRMYLFGLGKGLGDPKNRRLD